MCAFQSSAYAFQTSTYQAQSESTLEISASEVPAKGMYIMLGMLRVDGCRDMLARIVALAWFHRTVNIVVYCRAGKHRSVAVACMIEQLPLMFNPEVSAATEDLEKKAWGKNNCKGLARSVYRTRDEIRKDGLRMLPHEDELQKVWLWI